MSVSIEPPRSLPAAPTPTPTSAQMQAGVAGLALSAAATYAKFGIRVNVVSPGLTGDPRARLLGHLAPPALAARRICVVRRRRA